MNRCIVLALPALVLLSGCGIDNEAQTRNWVAENSRAAGPPGALPPMLAIKPHAVAEFAGGSDPFSPSRLSAPRQ